MKNDLKETGYRNVKLYSGSSHLILDSSCFDLTYNPTFITHYHYYPAARLHLYNIQSLHILILVMISDEYMPYATIEGIGGVIIE